MGLRRPNRIEYLPGQFLDMPTHQFDYEGSQELNGGFAPMTGAHYGYDLLSSGPAPKRNALERMRFLTYDAATRNPAVINALIDSFRAKLHEGGRLKLWSRGTEFDEYDAEEEVDRWAEARIVSIPSVHLTVENRDYAPMFLVFQRFGDWRDENVIELTFPITTNPQTVFITNPGSAKVYDAVMIFRGTFSLVGIHNRTNGKSFVSTRTGSGPNDWLRIDAGKRQVGFGDNGGVAYQGDWVNVTRLSGQTQLMVLEPGVNEFELFGSTSGDFDMSFTPAWH